MFITRRLTLLLTDKYIDRTTMKRPILTYLVLQESAIVLLHILRQVGIEHKRRNRCIGQLSAILDLDVLAFHTLWRVSLDDRQHNLVQLGSTYVSLSVNADAKIIGKSTNGAMRLRIAVSNVVITFWSLFSTKSHLLTTTTKLLLFF